MEKVILDGYNSAEGAKKYAVKFQKHWWERLNNQTEQKLMADLLGSIPRGDLTDTSLDMPCGYGRLYPLISNVAPKVIEGDYSFFLLKEAQQRTGYAPPAAPGSPDPAANADPERVSSPPTLPTGFTRGSALQFPFKNRAFDLVHSIRLCHHISSEKERLQYVRELFRIANKYVLFTFFDTNSIKNRVHARKIKYTGKRPKWTLTREQVEDVAREDGFEIVRCVPLSRFFSGHKYTLLKRIS